MKTCVNCGTHENITRHHCFPKRFKNWNKSQRKEVIPLCRLCHDDIERTIQRLERGKGQLKATVYQSIADAWCKQLAF
jgi:hypothetical protein